MVVCGVAELCNFNEFNGHKVSFVKPETVKIVQPNLIIKSDAQSLCGIFPNIRKLELNFEYLNEPGFIDCEFNLLDELILGGKLLDKTFENPLKNLLGKNTRSQSITIKSPSNYRTYQLIQKYWKNLEEVHIFNKIIENDDESDAQEEIFIPIVRKFEMRFNLEIGCHLPMAVIFGGPELRELSLSCYDAEYLTEDGYARGDRSYKFFRTLYRYPNIKSLYAGRWIYDIDILKLIGKFPRQFHYFTNL